MLHKNEAHKTLTLQTTCASAQTHKYALDISDGLARSLGGEDAEARDLLRLDGKQSRAARHAEVVHALGLGEAQTGALTARQQDYANLEGEDSRFS